ncbi:hypothetical protein BABINDRAFT_129486 [Babjeviella inositovora NRRL Y-12698]|uniref:Uncharacterized protein n=1 Tax=Babjeviella inositovora NRRL Y-12698 TaxID=984486 RepID=A0A1E3QTC0_9ASCO|nr:uncharacterized protein BABINDRAFT_129486 [Babjeviella inositovora NRRL Y-12698]ODQ80177.1 hypothetical protein BABINDRAFT_129486 [Babjeviella inositovora NRRL Y-12698]
MDICSGHDCAACFQSFHPLTIVYMRSESTVYVISIAIQTWIKYLRNTHNNSMYIMFLDSCIHMF